VKLVTEIGKEIMGRGLTMIRRIAGLLLTCIMEKGLGCGPPQREKMRGNLLSFNYALVIKE